MIIVQTLGSALFATIVYVLTSMTFINFTGDETEKGANGLQVLTVVLNFPIILAICAAVCLVVFKLIKPQRAGFMIYGITGLLAVAAGIFFW